MRPNNIYRLIVTLIVLWFLFSGMFKPMLLILGALSVAIVVWIAMRMNVLQHRGQPIYFRPLHIVRYWCWLIVEIMKSNWDVSKRILSFSMPIQPILTAIPAPQKTELGRIIYANSITLTPGTVAINIAKNSDIVVHALHVDIIRELEKGVMASKVCMVEPPLPSESL